MENRVYKFRGKTDNGKWIYGNLGTDTIILHGELSCKVIFENLDSFNTDNFAYVVNDHIVDEDTVGQFTGLKDKNNVEVYEGDILHVKEYRNAAQFDEEMDKIDIDILKAGLTDEYVGEVIFDEGSFFVCGTYLGAFFGDQRHSFPIHEIEVVGNIYDNKDLLNDKK